MNPSQVINRIIDREQITKLINLYCKNLHGNFTKSSIEMTVNKIIDTFSKLHSNMKYFDLGKLYTEEVPYLKRKSLGEIYTPHKIVQYILDAVHFDSKKNLHNKKLIDLSCGSGSFLIEAIRRLKTFYKQDPISNHGNASNLPIPKIKSIINNITDTIYGIDINPITCILSQLNLNFVLSDLYKLIWESENEYEPPLFNIYNLNSYDLDSLMDKFELNTFDYVIGNPPYVFIRSISERNKKIIESQDFKTKQGQYDSYQLFLELGIRFLRNGGYLGYIVPDSILALSNRAVIRKFICNSVKIKSISVVGEQFENSVVSNVILILQKEQDEVKRKENIIQVLKLTESLSQENKITQEMLKRWNHRFLINLNESDVEILQYLNENFPKLGDLMKDNRFELILSRGVELTKEGDVFFCKHCEKYYPLPKRSLQCPNCGDAFQENDIESIIFDKKPDSKSDNILPYLYSLQRYNITDRKYIDCNKRGLNYKELSNYEERVIIRQLNQDNLICASYYKGLLLCSQSYYNLKVNNSPNPSFDNIYLLGLLNSQLLSYYFIKSFGSYKKLFKRILIEKIKELPLKIPRNKSEQKLARDIKRGVKLLLKRQDLDSSQYKEIQAQIDSSIFKLYNLEKNHQEYINQFLNSIN